MNPINCKGQALLEAVFSAFVLIQFITVIFVSFYFIFMSIWIPHNLYELNICRSSYGATHQNCIRAAQKRIQLFIPQSKNSIPLIRTYQSKNIVGSTLQILFPYIKTPILFREELSL